MNIFAELSHLVKHFVDRNLFNFVPLFRLFKHSQENYIKAADITIATIVENSLSYEQPRSEFRNSTNSFVGNDFKNFTCYYALRSLASFTYTFTLESSFSSKQFYYLLQDQLLPSVLIIFPHQNFVAVESYEENCTLIHNAVVNTSPNIPRDMKKVTSKEKKSWLQIS